MEAIKHPNPFDTPPSQRWYGPDNTANLRKLKEEQAAARAKTPPIIEDYRDTLIVANEKIEALQRRVAELESEQAKKQPHLRARELRDSR